MEHAMILYLLILSGVLIGVRAYAIIRGTYRRYHRKKNTIEYKSR